MRIHEIILSVEMDEDGGQQLMVEPTIEVSTIMALGMLEMAKAYFNEESEYYIGHEEEDE